jgi:site-specific DNA-cytosine methylase
LKVDKLLRKSNRIRTTCSRYKPVNVEDERREKRHCIACCLSIEFDQQDNDNSLQVVDKSILTTTKNSSNPQKLIVTVDEVLCGIGGGRSAVRLLNSHKRKREYGDDYFKIISALDGNIQKRLKTDIYNETVWKGEIKALNLRIESSKSSIAHKQAKQINPLLTICGLPCKDLSRLGKCSGVINGATSGAFLGFFDRLKVTRSPLVIIEEVDTLLHKSNETSFNYIRRNLVKLGYHWRVCIIDAAKYGAAQQRRRAYFVCSLNPAVVSKFKWPQRQHKVRLSSLADSLLPPGAASRKLFLNPKSMISNTLSHPYTGLKRPISGHYYSRIASVNRGIVHVLSSARSCVATITASRSSGLYIWENDELRHLSGEEALRLFTFSKTEVEEYTQAAKKLHISSLQLSEMAGDSFVITVVSKLMRALVDAFSTVASKVEKEQWVK